MPVAWQALVPAAPALAACVCPLLGRHGAAAAARIATAGTAVAALCALAGAASGADRLGMTVATVVAAIAFLVHAFAARSMQGDPHYARFFATLSGATAASLGVAVATDLRWLAAAWILTGLGISALLAHYGSRARARRAALGHLALERIGDAAWIAVLVLAAEAGTFDPTVLAGRIDPAAGTACALALVLAGAVRSALVPFSRWLPDSMEAPTPVSALMHAGLVNGAGILLARTAPLVVHAPAALWAAAVLGGATAALGAGALLVRPEAKRRLGWSTVAQMGFMTLQCGCGAFGGAILHLALHGAYKAVRFLGVASVVAAERIPHETPGRGPDAPHPAGVAAAALAVPALGVGAVALLAGGAFAATPGAWGGAAIAWLCGVAAVRRALAAGLAPTARIAFPAGVAVAIAAYVGGVLLAENYLAPALPPAALLPPVLAVVAAAVAAGLAASLPPRAGGAGAALRDAAYVLALHEARPVPAESAA